MTLPAPRRVAAAVLCLAATLPAPAAPSRAWSVSSAPGWAEGTLDGTAIDGEGRVRLGPEWRPLWGPAGGIVWDLAPSGRRVAFAALSGPARVLRLQDGAEAQTWFEGRDDEMVTAVAADPEGGVLYARSPGGTVVHLRAPGKSEVRLEAEAAYVWDLAVGRDGTIWAATGDPGLLLRKPPRGEVQTVVTGGEDPLRALALHPDGGVVAGTGRRGRVLRVDASGRASVLLDAEEDEIAALAIAPDGAVYALAARERPRARATTRRPEEPREAPAEPESPPSTDPPGGAQPPEPPAEEAEARSTAPPRPTTPARPTPVGATGGALYRIDPAGGSRKIWESGTEIPYDVAIGADGLPVIGTGEGGVVLRLDAQGRPVQLLRFPSDQVTAVEAAPDGTLVLGGTSDARVAALGPALSERGTYAGAAVDAGAAARWGALRWDGLLPEGARVSLEVRSGNTSEPDETWSPWVEASAAPPGASVPSRAPEGRWAQVRATLHASRSGASPVLRAIELLYRTRNRAPHLTRLTIEPPGIVLVRTPQASPTAGAPQILDDPVTASAVPGRRSPGSPRRSYEPGVRSFTWKADDPDGDALTFAVEVRPAVDGVWQPLATDLTDDFLSWDSRGAPDGLYEARVVARDAADNAHGEDLADEIVSEAFWVDHTRPQIGGVATSCRRDARCEVSFVARDPGGRIASAEASLGGGPWRLVPPADGVDDTPEERYVLVLEPPPRGPVTVALRVTDRAGNTAGATQRLASD